MPALLFDLNYYNFLPLLRWFSHEDGEIVIWDLIEYKYRMSFNQHKAQITSLRFNKDSNLLASGSADTSIIVWDILSEQSLYQYVQ